MIFKIKNLQHLNIDNDVIFEDLLKSHMDGNHYLFIPSDEFEKIKKYNESKSNLFLNERQMNAFLELHDLYGNTVPDYVFLLDKSIIEIDFGDGESINKYLTQRKALQRELLLVCEDDNDCKIYEYLSKLLLSKEAVLNNVFSFNVERGDGGGVKTARELEKHIFEYGRLVFCIVDSDKRCEYDLLGETARGVYRFQPKLISSGKKSKIHILEEHELENLFGLYLEKFDVDKKQWAFFDFKKGFSSIESNNFCTKVAEDIKDKQDKLNKLKKKIQKYESLGKLDEQVKSNLLEYLKLSLNILEMKLKLESFQSLWNTQLRDTNIKIEKYPKDILKEIIRLIEKEEKKIESLTEDEVSFFEQINNIKNPWYQYVSELMPWGLAPKSKDNGIS